MSTIAALWQNSNPIYKRSVFGKDKSRTPIESRRVGVQRQHRNRNGLTLMTTITPEYLCRYLNLEGDSVVLRDSTRFSAPLSAERVLVESVKTESMWLGLYESGVFESMAFRALGDVTIENLSESEKDFCVRMAKEMIRVPAGEFMMGALDDDGVKPTIGKSLVIRSP